MRKNSRLSAVQEKSVSYVGYLKVFDQHRCPTLVALDLRPCCVVIGLCLLSRFA